MTSVDFVGWLEAELRERSWDISELARRSGLYASTYSRILSRERKPGPDACIGIARALKEPPEKVFRIAGLLPPLPGPEDDQVLVEIAEVARQLNPDERQGVLEYVRWRYRQQQGR